MEALKEILISYIGKRVENQTQDLVIRLTGLQRRKMSQQTVYIKVRTLKGMKPYLYT